MACRRNATPSWSSRRSAERSRAHGATTISPAARIPCRRAALTLEAPRVHRLWRRWQSLLPDGTSYIGWGLLVNGLTTYGYLVVARRALGDDSYSALAVLWSLVNIVGFGLFQPLEQEVARVTADRASRGLGSAPVLKRASALGAVMVLLASAAALAAWPVGLSGLLDDRVEMLVALLLALAAFAAAELVRGILSGRHLFGGYGWYFAVEGGTRMAVAVALAALGVAAVEAYAMAVACGLVLAVMVVAGSQRPLVRPGPAAAYRDITPALGFLLIASAGESFMLHVGPVAVDIVSSDDTGVETAGVFLNAMIVSRVPLFFFQAVKASLLPSLAAFSGRGDWAGFRDMQLKIVSAVVAVGCLVTVSMALLGPTIVRVVFDDSVSGRDMALLAASAAGLMLMLSLALGLVALGHARRCVIGWVACVVVFAVTMTLDLDVFLRVELALLSAVIAGSAIVALLLRVHYAAGARTS